MAEKRGCIVLGCQKKVKELLCERHWSKLTQVEKMDVLSWNVDGIIKPGWSALVRWLRKSLRSRL